MNSPNCLARNPCSGSRVGSWIAGDTPATTAGSRITLRRRGRGGGGRWWRAKIKLRGWRFLRAWLRSEEWSRRETEHARHKICGETPHRDVVVLHRLVEVAAFDRDPVLGSFQLRLQTEKVLVGL